MPWGDPDGNWAQAGPPSRIPPHNDEAEMALLGAILHNNRAYERVSDFLRPEHFANRVHGKIYEAVARALDRGQVADEITLKPIFDADPDFAELGGSGYLVRLAASVVSVINAGDYARAIYDMYLRRELIVLGEDVVNDAFDPDIDNAAANQIVKAENRLYGLATAGRLDTGLLPFANALTAAIESAEAAHRREGKLVGLTSGFAHLDALLGGLHRSDLLILAGRPSMGKTALAVNMAFNAAQAVDHDTHKRFCVGVFSLEMAAEQLAGRILADAADIDSYKIRAGGLTHDEFDRLFTRAKELEELSLFIDDTPALPISSLRARARRLKRQRGLDLVVVDYLQLLQGATTSRKENRVQELSEITRGLKAMAKELEVPVVALSQLSRAVEQRDDKRPQLSDLRESGSIEQDADVVMFVYRDEYYVARREPAEGSPEHDAWASELARVKNLAEVIVAKQRHGPIGKVVLHFDGTKTRFSDYAADDQLPLPE